jgi:CheY-like chemotaxis protein
MAQPRKIPCIEDDRETADLIVEELRDRGFEVGVAYGGPDGLMSIMRATPDLVLCDVSMPNMTGFEVLQRLNSAAVRTHTVRLSDRLGDRENELRGRQLGADDCVSNDRFGSIIEARASRAPSFSQNSSSSRIGRSKSSPQWRAARPRQTSRASSASPSGPSIFISTTPHQTARRHTHRSRD